MISSKSWATTLLASLRSKVVKQASTRSFLNMAGELGMRKQESGLRSVHEHVAYVIVLSSSPILLCTVHRPCTM